MKKATTSLRKSRAKSPVKTSAKTLVKSEAKKVLETEVKKSPKPSLKVDNNFWSGLIVVISGIVALLIFLSMFFRFVIGLALYNQLENQNLLSEEYLLTENESREIESSLEEFIKSSSSSELSSEMNVNSSEFMELPSDKEVMADLNFMNSPDGSKFAYVIRNEEGKYAVMLNDIASPYYDEILFMNFSPDSSHFVYGAELEGENFVVIDGKRGQSYDWILLPRFFTPDSKYFVYKVKTETGDRFVFNEAEQEVYDQLYNPFISSDKTEMIYYARRGNKIYKNSLVLEKYED